MDVPNALIARKVHQDARSAIERLDRDLDAFADTWRVHWFSAASRTRNLWHAVELDARAEPVASRWAAVRSAAAQSPALNDLARLHDLAMKSWAAQAGAAIDEDADCCAPAQPRARRRHRIETSELIRSISETPVAPEARQQVEAAWHYWSALIAFLEGQSDDVHL